MHHAGQLKACRSAIARAKKNGAGEAALRLHLTNTGEAMDSCSTSVAQTLKEPPFN